ncbi:PopZ family protein [Methylobacterium dankookense]|uniref:DUF2497 domain-containing protein n=1 Tax=Methylobacterium dankookense TaxID=560405 RepID=A0A564G0F6_9HYPH|nr:DUF2497 domain-containing protein [Methylobacterium dankookense]GJD55412.1 hypothetical protein IFDJLNFL_1297 [Methylobacterium dankookense]VUF13594.1 hypothetical protein MTDSW087_03301 [Methylobacterium dankookense]
MSAASPKIQDKTAEKAHEPSMEEILASIRRIIADDQAAKPGDAPPAKAPPPPPEPEDVLDLAEFAEPAPSAKPAPLDLDPIDFGLEEMDFDAIVVEPDPEPEPAPPPIAAAPPPPPVQPAQPARAPEAPSEPLTSSATDASVGNAFNMLAHTVLSRNARTLDDLVADMLRPMLKAWLDDNLPVMVERLVRAEIERVSRGR